MYLVELTPGKEATYGTLADFTDAIRRGEVGWQARVYHRGKSMWIPVSLHPHFRKFAGNRPADQALAPRGHWTFLPALPGERPSASGQAPGTPAESGPTSGSQATSTKAARAPSWRRVLGGLIGPRGD
jgi:hypothetical protein